jgi:hypothetical protein
MEKKLNRRCEHCGKIGVANVDVFWEIDFFTEGMTMGEEIVKNWYHPECSEELALSV